MATEKTIQINQSRPMRAGDSELTNERSATFGLQVGGNITLANYGRETCLGDIVNLLNARSARVDAIEGALVGADCGTDLLKLAGGQGTGNGLNTRKGLGDAELVFVRSAVDAIKGLAVCRGTKTYSARQKAFLTVG